MTGAMRGLTWLVFQARRLHGSDDEPCGDGTEPNYLVGFLMTVLAGFATMLGCAVIPFVKNKKNPKKVTAGSLGFAAGVMLYLSFVDILEEASEFFENHFSPPDCGHDHGIMNSTDIADGLRRLNGSPEEGDNAAIWVRVSVAGFFFAGIFMAAGLDKAVEKCQGSHGHGGEDSQDSDSSAEESQAAVSQPQKQQQSLEKISMVAFLALAAHNFPEGLATFFGGGTGSFAIVIAVAMHNIPEGMVVALPLYQATGSWFQVLRNTFIVSLAQPIGAAVAWILLTVWKLDDLPAFLYGAVYVLTAGVMVCVSIMELLPEAYALAPASFVSWFVFAGFAAMEFAFLLFYFV